MSKDNTLSREDSGLHIYTVEEELKTSATATSTPSLAVTSNGSSTFKSPLSFPRTEELAKAALLFTPKNQPIGNYEAIGLLLGSLKEFDEVQGKIEKDGFLDQEFEPMNTLVF